MGVPSASGKQAAALLHLRQLRNQTNEVLATPVAPEDVAKYKPPEPAPFPATLPQAVAEPQTLPPQAMFGKPTDQDEVMRRALEAVEEKKDRAASYGLLHSHMANFQYDFAVERNERTRLHGDVATLKQDVASMSEELRAVQSSEKELLRGGSPFSPLMDETRLPALSSRMSYADADSI